MSALSQLVMLGSHPQHGGHYRFACTFLKTDGGRSESRRPLQSNDCTVRALALATAAGYDAAYDALAAAGRKSGRGFDFREWAATANFHGYRFVWHALPAVKGQMRETPVTFASAHPSGRFILRLSKHVLACVHGVVMDISQDHNPMGLSYRCVYGFHEVVPLSSEMSPAGASNV